MTKPYSKTRILVEGALMIALSTVLSMIQIPLMPHGGSITLFSMVPILVMSYRHGAKWGVMTAFVNSLIQLVQGDACRKPQFLLGIQFRDQLGLRDALGARAERGLGFFRCFHKRVPRAARRALPHPFCRLVAAFRAIKDGFRT